MRKLPRAVAWRHTLDTTEGIKGNHPLVVLTASRRNPFGKPGEDYSASCPVTSTRLYTEAQMQAAYELGMGRAEVESEGLRPAVEAMVSMMEEGEWAEHVASTTGKGDQLAQRLEDAITKLHNEASHD